MSHTAKPGMLRACQVYQHRTNEMERLEHESEMWEPADGLLLGPTAFTMLLPKVCAHAEPDTAAKLGARNVQLPCFARALMCLAKRPGPVCIEVPGFASCS